MSAGPLLSFIVLSYNYAHYIGQTIRSIIDQTVQDFEIIVVDDASRDQSCDVIRSFADPRITLLINDRNLGGAASYNRAIEAATGKYLVNLDADDWIAPNKAERQLAVLARQQVEILGSYAWFVDQRGEPHPHAARLEKLTNQPHDLNNASAWIGDNNLVRSTTMVDRAAHLRIGLDDPSMVSAPDFELWTRALRAGCRFHVLAERLTYYRVHDGGVTHRDPTGTFLELSYAALRNLVPLVGEKNASEDLASIARWMVTRAGNVGFEPMRSHRLLGMLLGTPAFADFADFRRQLTSTVAANDLDVPGRRLWTAIASAPELALVAKLREDLAAVSEARDFWHNQSEELTQARDFWHQTSDAWEAQFRASCESTPAPPRIGLLRSIADSWHFPRRNTRN